MWFMLGNGQSRSLPPHWKVPRLAFCKCWTRSRNWAQVEERISTRLITGSRTGKRPFSVWITTDYSRSRTGTIRPIFLTVGNALGGGASKSGFISLTSVPLENLSSWTDTFHLVHSTPAITNGSFPSRSIKAIPEKRQMIGPSCP